MTLSVELQVELRALAHLLTAGEANIDIDLWRYEEEFRRKGDEIVAALASELEAYSWGLSVRRADPQLFQHEIRQGLYLVLCGAEVEQEIVTALTRHMQLLILSPSKYGVKFPAEPSSPVRAALGRENQTSVRRRGYKEQGTRDAQAVLRLIRGSLEHQLSFCRDETRKQDAQLLLQGTLTLDNMAAAALVLNLSFQGLIGEIFNPSGPVS